SGSGPRRPAGRRYGQGHAGGVLRGLPCRWRVLARQWQAARSAAQACAGHATRLALAGRAWETFARPGPQLLERPRALAVRAANLHAHFPVAICVHHAHRTPGVRPGPAITPSKKGEQNRDQLRTLLGEAVLAAPRSLLVDVRIQDPLGDQRVES